MTNLDYLTLLLLSNNPDDGAQSDMPLRCSTWSGRQEAQTKYTPAVHAKKRKVKFH